MQDISGHELKTQIVMPKTPSTRSVAVKLENEKIYSDIFSFVVAMVVLEIIQ